MRSLGQVLGTEMRWSHDDLRGPRPSTTASFLFISERSNDSDRQIQEAISDELERHAQRRGDPSQDGPICLRRLSSTLIWRQDASECRNQMRSDIGHTHER